MVEISKLSQAVTERDGERMILRFFTGFTLVIWALLSSSHASYNSLRTTVPLFKIASARGYDKGFVKLKGLKIKPSRKHPLEKASIFPNREMDLKIPKKTYERAKRLSRSVLKVTVKKHQETYYGTAFRVGPEILLTNYHVLFPHFYKGSCHNVSLKSASFNSEKVELSCSKVLLCDKKRDFCFFKVNEQIPSSVSIATLSTQVANPTTTPITLLAQGESAHNSLELFSVNNSYGLGLQASAGSGMLLRKSDGHIQLHFFAPLFPGASGSPVFDARDHVIALTRASTQKNNWNFYGKKQLNYATPISVILKQLSKRKRQDILAELSINSPY